MVRPPRSNLQDLRGSERREPVGGRNPFLNSSPPTTHVEVAGDGFWTRVRLPAPPFHVENPCWVGKKGRGAAFGEQRQETKMQVIADILVIYLFFTMVTLAWESFRG